MADPLDDFKKRLAQLPVKFDAKVETDPIEPIAPVGDPNSPSGPNNPAMTLPPTSWFGHEGESSKDYASRAKGIEVDLQGELQRRLQDLAKAGYDVEYIGEGAVKVPQVVKKNSGGDFSSSTSKTVIGPDDPVAAAFYSADNALREFSRIKGAGGFTDPAAGSGSGGGGATQKYDAVSLSDMFTNFAKQAQMVQDMQDADQAFATRAMTSNANVSKALMNNDVQWDTPGLGFMSTNRGGNVGSYDDIAAQNFTENPFDLGWLQPAGLIPRYAEGTNPLSMFDFATLVKQLQIPGLLNTGQQSGSAAQAGWNNTNAFKPVEQWQYGGQEYRADALNRMIDNIKAGAAAAPVGWNIDLSPYAGKDVVPTSVTANLAEMLRKDPNNPDIVYMMGAAAPPDRTDAYGNAPVDPYKYNADMRANLGTALDLAAFDLKMKEYQAQQVANASRGGGGSMPSAAVLRSMMGGGGGEGESMSDAQARSLALAEKSQAEEIAYKYATLKLDEEIQRGRLTLDQNRFEEEKRQQVFQDAYLQAMTKQIADNHDLALLKFAEDKTNAEFSRNMETAQFEEAKRRAAILEQQDREKLGIARAQAIAEYGSRGGGDAVARQFFMNNAGSATGTAKDIFTGEVTGQKTWEQTQQEDAPVYWGNSFAPTMQTMANGGYSTAPVSLVGDRASGRATGHEEVVLNPTGAPFAVLPNDLVRRIGIVPSPGRKLPANLFAGVSV